MIQATGSYFIHNNKLSLIDDIRYCIQDKDDIIYEVIRFFDFKPLFLDDHLDRFLMNFNLRPEEIINRKKQLTSNLHVLIKENGLPYGNIRFQFNHNSTGSFCAWLVPFSYPTDEQYIEGVRVKSFQAERNEPNIKTRDIRLRQHADEFLRAHDVQEAILVNEEGLITEGSRSNVFFIQDNLVVTPPLSLVLPGVTRQKIILLIHENKLNFAEKLIHVNDIKNFESCFISGTSPKILPVAYFNTMQMNVNNKLLILLVRLYNQHIDNYLTRFKWHAPTK